YYLKSGLSARKLLNSQQKNQLKTVQRKWIKRRDDNCASLNDGAVIMDLSCAKHATLTSIVYLWEINSNPDHFDALINEYEMEK
ncbi:lysozyme inhibitor LprI family protein, partial [Vibrio breoganii]